MKYQVLRFAIVCGLAVACANVEETADEADEAALTRAPHLAQMNDLTILFPLPQSAAEAERGQVEASSSGARGTLLPLRLYVDATGEPETEQAVPVGVDPGQPHNALRVVALLCQCRTSGSRRRLQKSATSRASIRALQRRPS
jgi:hypothetical protein